jgi:hypothetical protein
VSWGIKFALTAEVQDHGEHSDDANIWQTVQMDPPFADEAEAWKFCVEEDNEDDQRFTHRPFEIEDT